MFSYSNLLNNERSAVDRDDGRREAWQSEYYPRIVAPGRIKIHAALTAIAKHMFDDLAGFKILLRSVCFHYQAMNRHQFFKSQGKQRARDLLEKLDNIYTCAALLTLLKEALKHGNYHENSFKTVFHQRIMHHYPEHKTILSRESLDECWIVLDNFFNLLIAKIEVFERQIPGFIL